MSNSFFDFKNTEPLIFSHAISVKHLQNHRCCDIIIISIGNHVLIAGATFITHEGAHWVLKGLEPEKFKDTFGYGRITVCDNVYIGRNTTVLRGVTIGENTIVGACSLVNKSLEPNSVYAGVPAKKICSLDEFREKFLSDMPEFDLQNYKTNKKDEVLKIVDKFKKR